MPNNNATTHSFLILNLNANGLTKHKNEFLATLQNNKIDPDNTAHAVAPIIVKCSLLFYFLPQFQKDYIQASGIQITLNNTPLNIFAVYCPPRHNITSNQFNDFFLTLSHTFIIGGDLNTKNIQWGYRVNNSRGNIHEISTQNHNYKVHSPPSPTYWPTSPRKNQTFWTYSYLKSPSN